MTRESALKLIREMEADGLKSLEGKPRFESNIGQTMVVIPRELYAEVEKPPTRHRQFTIATRWWYPGWTPLSHTVFSGGRRPSRYRVVVENRLGLFGMPHPTPTTPTPLTEPFVDPGAS